MRAKELIVILQDNPDFEVETSISIIDDSKWGFHVEPYKITGLCDIGYFDKTIILTMEEV